MINPLAETPQGQVRVLFRNYCITTEEAFNKKRKKHVLIGQRGLTDKKVAPADRAELHRLTYFFRNEYQAFRCLCVAANLFMYCNWFSFFPQDFPQIQNTLAYNDEAFPNTMIENQVFYIRVMFMLHAQN